MPEHLGNICMGAYEILFPQLRRCAQKVLWSGNNAKSSVRHSGRRTRNAKSLNLSPFTPFTASQYSTLPYLGFLRLLHYPAFFPTLRLLYYFLNMLNFQLNL